VRRDDGGDGASSTGRRAWLRSYGNNLPAFMRISGKAGGEEKEKELRISSSVKERRDVCLWNMLSLSALCC